jgi:hypothetical protein
VTTTHHPIKKKKKKKTRAEKKATHTKPKEARACSGALKNVHRKKSGALRCAALRCTLSVVGVSRIEVLEDGAVGFGGRDRA